MPLLLDDNLQPLIAFHGTRSDFDDLDPSRTVDGGLHFGTQEQARMRCGKSGRIIQAHLEVRHARRSRDLGGNWKAKIRQAKSAGHDAIVYLNRYEGIPLERVEAAINEGVDLDKLTDAQFRKRIPEARDSWIVFSRDQVRVIEPQAESIPTRRPGLR